MGIKELVVFEEVGGIGRNIIGFSTKEGTKDFLVEVLVVEELTFGVVEFIDEGEKTVNHFLVVMDKVKGDDEFIIDEMVVIENDVMDVTVDE
jgi:hypothetical protein